MRIITLSPGDDAVGPEADPPPAPRRPPPEENMLRLLNWLLAKPGVLAMGNMPPNEPLLEY